MHLPTSSLSTSLSSFASSSFSRCRFHRKNRKMRLSIFSTIACCYRLFVYFPVKDLSKYRENTNTCLRVPWANDDAVRSFIIEIEYRSSSQRRIVDIAPRSINLKIKCNVFSERELKFMFAICRRPSVCLSSVCLSVTFVRPTQTIEIFGNVSTL